MPSPNTYIRKPSTTAFTLIEILVVTAIITTLAGVGIIIGLDSYQRSSYHSEQNSLVHVLQKARSRSMNNMFEMQHGVHIDASNYVIFRNTTGIYNPADTTNESVPKNPGVTVSGATDIVFSQLSGDPDFAGNLTISDGVRTDTISLNSEGRINW